MEARRHRALRGTLSRHARYLGHREKGFARQAAIDGLRRRLNRRPGNASGKGGRAEELSYAGRPWPCTAGLRSGIISGRTSILVERRARELGIQFVRQGALDKIKHFDELLAEANVSEREVAFVGDDVTDIPLMRRSELAVAVADAVDEARSAAHYVTRTAGGFGAVREVCELILKAQVRWSELIERYTK